jgi:ABC-type glycerol-3-phosphate transport system substrate-binding protein
MKNLNILNAIILGISGIAIVAAIIIFAAYRGTGSSSTLGTVELWGTIPAATLTPVLQELALEDEDYANLSYIEKSPETFEDELLKALAEGTGPDLVLMDEKQVMTNQRRMQTIPYESFPIRTFQDLFLDEGNLLLARDGVLGFPFLVDPLVMYYNKDTLSNYGFARPPETWTEILAITPTLTQKDSSFNISKSTIALGSFENIRNAKDIFWTLTLQAGNPVFERYIDDQTNEERYRSTFNQNLNFTLNPAYAATNFFTQFSNPTKTVYTWNRSLPESQTMFVSGDLAFYIGYASELPTIQRVNPNLNFDVALLPQSQTSTRKVTYGSMKTLVIPKTSQNMSGAITMIAKLTSRGSQEKFSAALGIPSVRRDLLSSYDAASTFESVFNRSAVIAQGILEPDARQTDGIIRELIDTVVSGQYEISAAINRAHEKLNALTNG